MKYIITDDQIKYIEDELAPVRDKIGAFKLDPVAFAWGVMEESTEHAKNILTLLEEIKKQHHDIGS